MTPCPKGLHLLRDYLFDKIIERATSGATESITLNKSARRVGICIAFNGSSVNIYTGQTGNAAFIATFTPTNNAHTGMYWADELGPAIYDNLILQFNGGPAIAKIWEVNLPTDYKE